MISLFGKWLFTEEADVNPRQECFVVELEEGDWLLVDVELTNEDEEILKDYVVIPVVDEHGTVKLPVARNKGNGERNIEKSQKYFHGKMISRMFLRKAVQPYKIERPLRYSPPDDDEWRNIERLQKVNCLLEMITMKVPRPLGKLGNMTVSRVNVKSLKSPAGLKLKSYEPGIEPMKLQPKHVLIDDLSSCKAVVPFESSPVKKLLWDLENLTRKRGFEFVGGIGHERQAPLRMALNHDHVYDLVQLSIRKRRKFNSVAEVEFPSFDPSVVSSEPARTPVPLLALEWKAEQSQENWFVQPALSVISDICEMTSRLKYHLPKAAMFLWTHFLQLLSVSKKYLSRKASEDDARGRSEVVREPTRECYLSLCGKGFGEERSRALARKKTKRQDTKKNLKRAHAAMTQKYHHNTNRKRAMGSGRFQRGCGRRGC